jgi:ureidoacrylate peracid hydrolase
MHKFSLPQAAIAHAIANRGKAHPCDTLDPARTALVVIDMQNYFVAPGEMGEAPLAREIVPNINRLADATRQVGGHVIWVQNSTNDTRQSWSVLHETMMTPARRERRYAAMDEAANSHRLWPAMDARPEDARIVKKRFSAFIQGASAIEAYLRPRGIDTLLITGTATNVCCESTARDAMMLNYRVAMISDGTATFTDEIHAATLMTFFSFFGDVLTTDEAIAALVETPKARTA